MSLNAHCAAVVLAALTVAVSAKPSPYQPKRSAFAPSTRS
jgi:hypothetical protein